MDDAVSGTAMIILEFRFSDSFSGDLQGATSVCRAVFSAIFRGLSVGVSIATNGAVVNSLVDLDGFDSLFLHGHIPQRGVLCLKQSWAFSSFSRSSLFNTSLGL